MRTIISSGEVAGDRFQCSSPQQPPAPGAGGTHETRGGCGGGAGPRHPGRPRQCCNLNLLHLLLYYEGPKNKINI